MKCLTFDEWFRDALGVPVSGQRVEFVLDKVGNYISDVVVISLKQSLCNNYHSRLQDLTRKLIPGAGVGS